MSNTRGIKFNVVELGEDEVRDILNHCTENGWSINDHGKISYFVINFDWISEEISYWNKVKEQIIDRFREGEVVGISIINFPENTGGELLIINRQEIIFSISINIRVPEHEDVDIQYYLDLLKVILKGIPVNTIEILS